MGQLVTLGELSPVYLAERSLIGRGRDSWVRLSDKSVSSEHAVISHGAEGWCLRDLGSRNGTWVNGKSLRPGEVQSLAANAELRFGTVVLLLVDANAPSLCVRQEGAGTCFGAQHGMLTLPPGEEPQATLYETQGGQWVLELDGNATPVEDGDTIYLGGGRFQIRIPTPQTQRIQQSTAQLHQDLLLSELTLKFHVAQDRESTVVELAGPTRTVTLAARAPQLLLLALAEQRLSERQRGVPEAECGWVYTDECAKNMGYGRERLNVDIHRLRQQLLKAGVRDASKLVERRPTSKQLRLAVGKILIS